MFLEAKKKDSSLSEEDEYNIFQTVKKAYLKEQNNFLESVKNSIEEQMTRKGTSRDKLNAICLQINKGGIFRLDLLHVLFKMCSKDHQLRKVSESIEAFSSLLIYDLLPLRNLFYFTENNLEYFVFLKQKESRIFQQRNEILMKLYFEHELKKLVVSFLEMLKEHFLKKTNTSNAHLFFKLKILTLLRMICFRFGSYSSSYLRKFILNIFVDLLKNETIKSENQQLQQSEQRQYTSSFVSRILSCLKTLLNEDSYFYCFHNLEEEENGSNKQDKIEIVKSIIQMIFSIHNKVVFSGIELLVMLKFNGEKEKELIILRTSIFLKIIKHFHDFQTGKQFAIQQKQQKKNNKNKNKNKKKKTKSKSNKYGHISNELIVKILRNIRFSIMNFITVDMFLEYVDVFFTIARKTDFSVCVEVTSVLFAILQRLKKRNEQQKEGEFNFEKFVFRYYMLLYSIPFKFDGFSNETKSSNEFLGVLKFSLLMDSNETRVKAFVRRILQVLNHSSSNFVVSTLMVIRSLVTKKPFLSSLFHHDDDEQSIVPPPRSSSSYNPNEMNPLKSGVDNEKESWELLSLSRSYHPLIRKASASLIDPKKNKLGYVGQPMQDFSTMGVLNEFIQLNKQQKEEEEEQGEEGEQEGEVEKLKKKKIVEKKSFLHPFFRNLNLFGINEQLDDSDEKGLMESSHRMAFFRKGFLSQKKEDLSQDDEEEKEEKEKKEEDKEEGDLMIEEIEEKSRKILGQKRKRKKILDFSDNRIERVFLGLDEETGNEGEGGAEDGDEWIRSLQPQRKRRKIDPSFLSNPSHIENEISEFHEEQEEMGARKNAEKEERERFFEENHDNEDEDEGNKKRRKAEIKGFQKKRNRKRKSFSKKGGNKKGNSKRKVFRRGKKKR